MNYPGIAQNPGLSSTISVSVSSGTVIWVDSGDTDSSDSSGKTFEGFSSMFAVSLVDNEPASSIFSSYSSGLSGIWLAFGVVLTSSLGSLIWADSGVGNTSGSWGDSLSNCLSSVVSVVRFVIEVSRVTGAACASFFSGEFLLPLASKLCEMVIFIEGDPEYLIVHAKVGLISPLTVPILRAHHLLQ